MRRFHRLCPTAAVQAHGIQQVDRIATGLLASQRRPLEPPTIWLQRLGACLPFAKYSSEEQARLAEEVAALPEGALIPGWLADYAVLRNQARVCSRR